MITHLNMLFSSGQKIHDLEVIKYINKGNFASVYQVKNSNDEFEAIKAHPNIENDDKKRFLLENQILHHLHAHHFIIAPYSNVITLDNSCIYYRMELADYNLEKYLNTNILTTHEEKIKLFRDICEGLHYAHVKNVIHRDLWWNNILLKSEAGQFIVKINDFGRSKNFENSSFFNYNTFSACWGKRTVIPPEYYFNIFEESDTQNNIVGDLYALGIVLYYILELREPVTPLEVYTDICKFYDKDNLSILDNPTMSIDTRKQFYERWLVANKGKVYDPAVLLLDVKVNNRVNAIIKKICNIDYRLRYQSVQEIIDDIDYIFV